MIILILIGICFGIVLILRPLSFTANLADYNEEFILSCQGHHHTEMCFLIEAGATSYSLHCTKEECTCWSNY